MANYTDDTRSNWVILAAVVESEHSSLPTATPSLREMQNDVSNANQHCSSLNSEQATTVVSQLLCPSGDNSAKLKFYRNNRKLPVSYMTHLD